MFILTASVCIFIDKAFKDCQNIILKIKTKAPVFDVIQIVFDPFGNGSVPR